MRLPGAAAALATALVMVAALSPAAQTAAAKSGASDKTLLKAGVLVARDVPKSWKSAATSGTTTNTLKGISGCEEMSAADSFNQRRALSRFFYDPATRGRGGVTTQASNLVHVFKTPTEAARYLSAFKHDNAAACFGQATVGAAKSSSPGFDVTATKAGPVTDLGNLGDDRIGYEVVLAFSRGSQVLMDSVDLVDVQVGRTVVGFKFGRQDQPVAGLTDIVSRPVNRLVKAEK